MPRMSYPVSLASPKRQQGAEYPSRCVSWCWPLFGEDAPVQSLLIIAKADSGCNSPPGSLTCQCLRVLYIYFRCADACFVWRRERK